MSAASDGFARQAAIQRSPNSPWILVLQLLRQCRIGKILITHGTQEKRRIAAVPTDVNLGSAVAGYGPP